MGGDQGKKAEKRAARRRYTMAAAVILKARQWVDKARKRHTKKNFNALTSGEFSLLVLCLDSNFAPTLQGPLTDFTKFFSKEGCTRSRSSSGGGGKPSLVQSFAFIQGTCSPSVNLGDRPAQQIPTTHESQHKHQQFTGDDAACPHMMNRRAAAIGSIEARPVNIFHKFESIIFPVNRKHFVFSCNSRP